MKVLFKVLGFIFIVATLLFALIGKVGWAIFYALIAVLMFVIKPKPIVKPEPENKTPPPPPRYDHEWFKVVGVTYNNDDGTSRQRILKTLCDGDKDGTAWAKLEAYEYEGAPAVRVMTEEGCVGNIGREHVQRAMKLVDRPANKTKLNIESFTADRKRIFRADVVIEFDRENPEQQWYFDELQ